MLGFFQSIVNFGELPNDQFVLHLLCLYFESVITGYGAVQAVIVASKGGLSFEQIGRYFGEFPILKFVFQATNLPENGSEIPAKVDPKDSFVLIPVYQGSVQTVCDLLGDAFVPFFEHFVLVGYQHRHHFFVLPKDQFSTFFETNGMIELLEAFDAKRHLGLELIGPF